MNLDPQLMELIVCPDCHGTLAVEEEAGGDTDGRPAPDGSGVLVCTACGLAYPVRDDIPILLVDEARKPA